MQKFAKNAFTALFFSTLSFVALSVPAHAQVLAHSAEAAGTVGYVHTSYSRPNGPTPNHSFFGGSGGYNITPYITILGEYKYDSLGTSYGANIHAQNYGGAARFNLRPSGKVVPYGVVGGGGFKFTEGQGSLSITADGTYVNFGGGASIYLSKNWGVRPELRYERQQFSYNSIDISANAVTASGSFFYQFGGTGAKKK
jgi:hypothetical protein